jgi:diguanylate cyclase (GGDEF)-like protein/PAS domain S-box-containing protein
LVADTENVPRRRDDHPAAAARELCAAENALFTSEQRLQDILETAPLAFVSTDAEGLILDWNSEAELMFGWSRSEALGRKLASTLLPQPVRPAYDRELAELLETDDPKLASRRVELTTLTSEGRELPVEMTVSRVFAQDGHLFRIYARDLSQQRQADDDRRYAEEQLTYQALHDPLTGLPNRTLLLDRIGHALALAKRHGSTAALLYVDIDNFKLINESLGHDVGDELLICVARRLQDVLRSSDTVARVDRDILARVGGDEFVVLCESLAAERDAIDIAERIGVSFAEPFQVADQRLFVRLSIGIALNNTSTSSVSVIRDADAAMYRAKERGGDRYELFDPEIRARVLDRIRKENELRDAIEADQLRLHYQPIVAVLDGAFVGAEALLRWDHPERGLVAPLDFIPLAEESGLIVPFGRWVLERALEQLVLWQATLGAGSPLRVSVNISARQVMDDDLPTLIHELLKRYRVRPSQLVLEFTESILLDDTEARAAVLGDLRKLGVRLALDDFGTGYSSLAYLRRLPFDALKLDRSFISGLAHTVIDPQITAAVIEMARALEMTVIAEGVEEGDQLECLRRLGCHFAQGYYFAAPMPAAELTVMLQHAASTPAQLPANITNGSH